MTRTTLLLLAATCLVGCASGTSKHAAAGGAGAPAADSGKLGATSGGRAAPAANPCVLAGTCTEGTWTNVTPNGVDLENMLGCGNYGTQSMQADPDHPGHYYTLFMCQGEWKTTDFAHAKSLLPGLEPGV